MKIEEGAIEGNCTIHHQHCSRGKVRRSSIRKKGKCFLGLISGHIIKHRDSQYKCQKCGGHHHVSICEKNANKPPAPGGKVEQQRDHVRQQQINQPSTKSETAQKTQTETSTLYVESNTAVLLQTAQSLVGSNCV